jgi:hypothetical protein
MARRGGLQISHSNTESCITPALGVTWWYTKLNSVGSAWMSRYAPFRTEVRHTGLHKYRIITGDDWSVVQEKARVQQADWDAKWATLQDRQNKVLTLEQQKQLAVDRSNEAQRVISDLERLLASSHGVDTSVKWQKLQKKGAIS